MTVILTNQTKNATNVEKVAHGFGIICTVAMLLVAVTLVPRGLTEQEFWPRTPECPTS